MCGPDVSVSFPLALADIRSNHLLLQAFHRFLGVSFTNSIPSVPSPPSVPLQGCALSCYTLGPRPASFCQETLSADRRPISILRPQSHIARPWGSSPLDHFLLLEPMQLLGNCPPLQQVPLRCPCILCPQGQRTHTHARWSPKVPLTGSEVMVAEGLLIPPLPRITDSQDAKQFL